MTVLHVLRKTRYLQEKRYPLIVITLFLCLSGCFTQIAPDYDRSVVDDLNSINIDVMTLLAAMSSGTNASDFEQRQDYYNQVIGKLDALMIQAGARPVPNKQLNEKVNAALEARGVGRLADDEIPSVHAIQKISDTLTFMRNTDKQQGVTAVEVKAFRGQVVIYLDQALTYENFLQR